MLDILEYLIRLALSGICRVKRLEVYRAQTQPLIEYYSKQKGVLLVHGLTGSPLEMKFVGKQLNKMGFTVYAPTLAGHCQDEKALVETTYEDWIGGGDYCVHIV